MGYYPLGWAGSVHSAGCYTIHGGDGKLITTLQVTSTWPQVSGGPICTEEEFTTEEEFRTEEEVVTEDKFVMEEEFITELRRVGVLVLKDA